MYIKTNSRQITVAEMAPHVHHFDSSENKVDKISNWLISWINNALANGKIKPYDLMPSKGDLAFHIGVSQGTMQNVFRTLEDYGLIKSKQRIGSFISNSEELSETNKLTSKREITVEAIKKYIKLNNLQPGSKLLSTRKLADILGVSGATVRTACGNLVLEGILQKSGNIFVVSATDFTFEDLHTETLVEKTAESIKKYIEENFKTGERLTSNKDLASRFNVSIKTIHDALKLLTKQGIVVSLRGQYGTIIVNNQDVKNMYFYEHIELQIRNYIAQNCNIGSKLPSIKEFSDKFKVSCKTIKKALDNLEADGYVMFTRGRYGGTFVTDMPQSINDAYKWLALSSEYIPN